MNETFLKIEHELFDSEKNIFELAGTEGFTLYCTLLYYQASSPSVCIRLKDVQTFLTREYDKRLILTYSAKKKCKVNCLKDKETITKYFGTLVRIGLVEILNLQDLIAKQKNKEFKYERINLSDTLIIKCKKEKNSNKWNAISTDLFEDYIYKIGHTGWSILCLLSKLHNKTYGNIMDGGFANPTEEYISIIISKSIDTVSVYLYMLQNQKLIKIQAQEPITIINKYGNEEDKYLPNHYIVKHKINGDKYFLSELRESNKNEKVERQDAFSKQTVES